MLTQRVLGSSLALLASLMVSNATTSGAAYAAGACGAQHAALVIGERSYPDNEAPLGEPIGNARHVAQTLRQLGFETEVDEDLTKAKLRSALDQFVGKIQPGAVVFLFFSGLGTQSGGHTYLLPVDATIWSDQDIRTNGVDLDRLLADMAHRGAKVRIVAIDAARRNPFERRFRTTGSAGLAPVSGAENLLAIFSEVPGAVFDETGAATSPFVDELTMEMDAPGAMAEEAFRRTRIDVSHFSRTGQRAWLSSSLSEDLPLDVRDCHKAVAARDEHTDAPAPKQDRTPAAAVPRPKVEAAPAKAEQADTGSQDRLPPKETAPPPPRDAARTARAEPAGAVLGDPVLIEEIRDRLFEQNLDPGAAGSSAMTEAIRKYESRADLPKTGQPTQGLLQSLRDAEALKPWGAITFASDAMKWGMAWGSPSRRQALAVAKARCGSETCTSAVSFFGKRCGAFALSSRSWAINWRTGADAARKAALGDCGKRGQACRLIGAVCADGSDKTN